MLPHAGPPVRLPCVAGTFSLFERCLPPCPQPPQAVSASSVRVGRCPALDSPPGAYAARAGLGGAWGRGRKPQARGRPTYSMISRINFGASRLRGLILTTPPAQPGRRTEAAV